MRVVFMGTGEIALPSFRWLQMIHEIEVVALVTQPDKPVGRKLELTPPRIKLEALQYGVPVLQPVRMRSPEAIAEIQALRPDVIVVMAYGQILPKAVLNAPKIACLNLHASLLPRWRGAAPIHACIEAGDAMTGVTVMYMDEGLDTGDILLMRQMRIRRRETGGTLHDRMAEEAPGALAVALAMLGSGRAPRVPQPAEGVAYAGKLGRESGEIAWAAGRVATERRIRAMNPWPAAATTLPTREGAKRLKVFSAIQYRKISGPAGVVIAADARGLLVGAGDGALLLTEIQLEGKRRMRAGDFLLGNPVAPGTKLGA